MSNLLERIEIADDQRISKEYVDLISYFNEDGELDTDEDLPALDTEMHEEEKKEDVPMSEEKNEEEQMKGEEKDDVDEVTEKVTKVKLFDVKTKPKSLKWKYSYLGEANMDMALKEVKKTGILVSGAADFPWFNLYCEPPRFFHDEDFNVPHLFNRVPAVEVYITYQAAVALYANFVGSSIHETNAIIPDYPFAKDIIDFVETEYMSVVKSLEVGTSLCCEKYRTAVERSIQSDERVDKYIVRCVQEATLKQWCNTIEMFIHKCDALCVLLDSVRMTKNVEQSDIDHVKSFTQVILIQDHPDYTRMVKSHIITLQLCVIDESILDVEEKAAMVKVVQRFSEMILKCHKLRKEKYEKQKQELEIPVLKRQSN
jgi:hypothetical protein